MGIISIMKHAWIFPSKEAVTALPGDGRHGIGVLGRYKWHLLPCLMLCIL